MVILYFILWTLTLGLQLSGFRWVEMVIYGNPWPSVSSVLHTIITGFRFDMMVVGFWLTPLVVYLIFTQILRGSGVRHPRAVKIYLVSTWVFMAFLYLKDLISFGARHDRLWLGDHLQNPFLNFEQAKSIEWWVWVIAAVLLLGLLRVGITSFDRMIKNLSKINYFSIAFIFLWTVLISRGTLTQHHLRQKDCQFSTSSKIEALCLNPLFTFSKYKR